MSRSLAALIVLTLAGFATWRAFTRGHTDPQPDPQADQPAASVPEEAPRTAEGFVLRGRVVTRTGAPVAGLPIGALPRPNGLGGPLPDTGRFQARTETLADGSFELRSSVTTTLWVGPLHGPGLPPFLASPASVRFGPDLASRAPLTFEAAPAQVLQGVVRLERAPGVAPAEVRVMVIGERTGHSSTAGIDAEGRFTFTLLHDEPYTCAAVATAYVSAPAFGVAPKASATGAAVELTLEPVAALRVEVEGGQPEGLRVECAPLEGHPVELARLAFAGRGPNFLSARPQAVAAFTTDRFGFVPRADPGPRDAAPTVAVALGPAAQLELSNVADAPRIVVVEQGGRAVRAQSLALASQMVLTVPPGDLRVHVYDLSGALLAGHDVTFGAAGLRSKLDVR